ncbi:hypothetical protein CR513_24806, partial [Mucuna pruriens]
MTYQPSKLKVESEYEKVHSCKSSKEIKDTLALAYRCTSQVKDSKISMLAYKYELFTMDDNETINLMFGRFQKIINNLRSLGKTYDNYDHITKILRSLPRRWRPQVTTLRASKDLKKLPMEELLGMLKFSKMEALKGSTSKAFKVVESCGDISYGDFSYKDELSFILRKIQSMWKHKRGPRWKNNFKKHTKETENKTQVVCYECKELGNFKSECPNLEKKEEKEKKKTFIKKKKSLMAT